MKLAGLGALGYALMKICLWPSKIAATIVHQTIDDQRGDSVTYPRYYNQTCGSPRSAAGTDRPAVGPMRISMQFNGPAIYVHFILVNHEGDGITTFTSTNFTVDSEVPFKRTISDPSPSLFNYNGLVFSNASLPSTLHTLNITTTCFASAYFNFKYAISIHDFDSLEAPPRVTSPKSSTSDSSSRSVMTATSYASSTSFSPSPSVVTATSYISSTSDSSSWSVMTATSYASSTNFSSSLSVVTATSYVSSTSDPPSLLSAVTAAPEKSSTSGAILHSTAATGAKSLAGAIVGGTAAAIVMFGIVILLLLCWRRRGGYHVLQEGKRNDSIPLVTKVKTRPSVRSTTSSMTAVIPARLAIEKGYGYGMAYSDIAPKFFEADYQCNDDRTLPAGQVNLYPAGSGRFSSFSGKTFVSSTSNSSNLYTSEDRRSSPPAPTSPCIETIQEEIPVTLQEEIGYQLRTVQLNNGLHATGVGRRSQEVGAVETADIGGGRGYRRGGGSVSTWGSPVLEGADRILSLREQQLA